ncbi:MAG TPA: hypothetical protein VKL61_04680, partial [Candidatus Polarisedimenticolia bacterium]|nr:hypothetical protein [Candidatus Polarisedimenticolia bacterium]
MSRKQPKRGRRGRPVTARVAAMVRGHASFEVDSRVPFAPRAEFYPHDVGWANRLILGDSLIVMNSLLGRELMAGKVQMAYVDPSSGGADSSNSLAYLRACLRVCRELLNESGSIFVRIGGEKLPGVRTVMDEVFGARNCCGIVTFRKAS